MVVVAARLVVVFSPGEVVEEVVVEAADELVGEPVEVEPLVKVVVERGWAARCSLSEAWITASTEPPVSNKATSAPKMIWSCFGTRGSIELLGFSAWSLPWQVADNHAHHGQAHYF